MDPPRKRRTEDEIKQDKRVFKCDHCMKALTRPQTLREHIQKFHPQSSPELPGKEKGKGKNIVPIISSSLSKQEVSFVKEQDIEHLDQNASCNDTDKETQDQGILPEQDIVEENITIDLRQKILNTPEPNDHFGSLSIQQVGEMNQRNQEIDLFLEIILW